MGGVAAKLGFLPLKYFLSVGAPGLTVLLGTTQMSLQNGISFSPMALAESTGVTDDTHTHTYRKTDHAMVKCVAFSDAA